jgi:anti-repressor protein
MNQREVLEQKLHSAASEIQNQIKGLNQFLEVKTPFRKWIDRMFEYDFEENRDFVKVDKNVQGNKAKEFALTIECTKEISMLQRTEKGKQARRYFIEIEKNYREINPTNDPIIQMRMQQLQIKDRVETRYIVI